MPQRFAATAASELKASNVDHAAFETGRRPRCVDGAAIDLRCITRRSIFEAFAATGRLLPTILQRGRFPPQTIELTNEKILVRTPGMFNLSQREEEIPWRKVAGFDYKSGIFWDQVTMRPVGSRRLGCPASRNLTVGGFAKCCRSRIVNRLN